MADFFRFKHFVIHQTHSALKVGTDAMILGSLIEQEPQPFKILDIGAGTGVLSFMVSQKFSKAIIDSVEIDEQALLDLEKNISANDAINVRPHLADIRNFASKYQYDLIISNPPFYEESLLGENSLKNLAKHVIGLPLEQLLAKVMDLLAENGTFYFIWPATNTLRANELFDKTGLFVVRKIDVYGTPSKMKRIVYALKKEPVTDLQLEEVLIREADGQYSEQYIALTRDYHFNDLKG